MKKAITILIVLVICFSFYGCDSENIQKAKDDYANEEYAKVVKDLKGEKDLDSETQEILAISKAHIANENKDYLTVIELLNSVKDGKALDLYDSSKKEIVSDAIKKADASQLSDAIKMDSEIGKYAADEIIKRCKEYTYNAFVVAESLIKSMDDGKIKNKIENYLAQNKLDKPKAFLIGKWEWQYDAKNKTTIEVVPYKKNLMGTVGIVGDNEKEFKIYKEDVYWKDFTFVSDTKFTCLNLSKTRDGIASECLAVGKINYSKDQFKLHVTAEPPYIMVNPDRLFNRK